ncbi:TetR family transcriptional regulator [Ramlibacter ginsenosidimutans]|uniref:TetR family transcriptional regulator n=1 Tax=Ramlibacter ginsenosidimutans TaxID=502333 RepID=A0A934WQ64_9BURK|nr:TetR family transcriptional regulator [Ramlibacter ginsenosidimutans]
MSRLSDLQSEVTERLILEAALKVLERTGEITARAAAIEAGIAERTLFRYFGSREDFLAAAATALARTVQLPPAPTGVEELRAMPRGLFTAMDAHRELIRAAWHSELRQHMIAKEAKERWLGIRKVLDAVAPRAPERRRKLAAATLRYHLSATTWHYFRFVLLLPLEDTIEAAELLVDQQLAGLAGKAPRPSR